MDRIEQIAKEISTIVPKWVRLVESGFILPPTLTMSQISVLLAVYEQGQATSGRISKAMHVSAPTITGIVSRLVRKHALLY